MGGRMNACAVDRWAGNDMADLGYPRLVTRADGRLACMYYWATVARPEQHIACTVWHRGLYECCSPV
jgi:hypothetical protein